MKTNKTEKVPLFVKRQSLSRLSVGTEVSIVPTGVLTCSLSPYWSQLISKSLTPKDTRGSLSTRTGPELGGS